MTCPTPVTRWALALVVSVAAASATGTSVAQQAAIPNDRQDTTLERILDRIPDGTTWNMLDSQLKTALEARAMGVVAADRLNWGPTGLNTKLNVLMSATSPLMAENVDRVLSDLFASVLPAGFKISRDVQNADLKKQLLRLYLTVTSARGYMMSNHPEFRSWDGRPVRELPLLDHEHERTMAEWNRRTGSELKNIPESSLSQLEIAIRSKSYFTTRAGEHFDRPALGASGAPFYSNLYEKYPFSSDSELLDAYNAMLVAAFREVNVGTIDAVAYDYDSEFNETWLKSQKIPDHVAKYILKIGVLYRSKLDELDEAKARCTIYSAKERAANWDATTAALISNADRSETMESYAAAFEAVAAQQRRNMQNIAVAVLERLFPQGSPYLSSDQRARAADKLLAETQPARMFDTLISALDEVTGSSTASEKIKSAISNQPAVGGAYSPGEQVRGEDKKNILDMWQKSREFIANEYSGYRIDLAPLIPEEPIISTTGQNQFTIGGKVNIALQTKWNLASLSSTMLHEIKHAIDQNSHAPIEGAAWEGAATSVERQVWPVFIERAMAGQGDLVPIAILKTEVDNVRFTATTDATLKIFLRPTCTEDEPDSIAFAKSIVQSYGYTDDDVLTLRSRRAHRSTQYLEYEYGLQMYTRILDYLQQTVGNETRVDAFLLQACGIPNPVRDAATAEDLKACIRGRKH